MFTSDNPIVSFAIRGFQALFAIVVLGLSVTLAKGHHWGGLPATIGYVCFVGAISLLAAGVGFAANWIDLLQGKIGAMIDAFILLLNLAGGIVAAFKIRGAKCVDNFDEDNANKILSNDWMNGGCQKIKGETWCYYVWNNDVKGILSRCRESQADTVFMFLTVIVLLVSILMTWLRMKKGY